MKRKLLTLLLSATFVIALTFSATLFSACDVLFGNSSENNGEQNNPSDKDPDGGDKKPDDKHTHKYGEWKVITPATCTQNGKEERTCSCGETESRTIIAEGHKGEWTTTKEATCTKEGIQVKKCTVCKEILEKQPIEPIPHIYTQTDNCDICGFRRNATVGLEYRLDLDSKSYAVVGIGKVTDTEIVITDKYNGLPVTSIGSYAFSGCSGLTSITIPDSVTYISWDAFYDCSTLTSITIPDNVTSIDDSAFSGCGGLTSITIPDSVTYIGSSAFSGCGGLTSITIGNSVTSIGWDAFYDCSTLTSITIPDSVTYIGSSAFSGCSGLTSVTIGNGVTSIGNSAFSGCPIENAVIPAIACGLIKNDKLKTVVITSGDSIGSSAFSGCSGLTSITIPDSVTSIGDYAFSGCSGLTSITIPDGVTSVGSSAFMGCSSLISITIPDSVTSIGRSAFGSCSSLERIDYQGDIASWCGISGLNELDKSKVYISGQKLTEMTKIVIPDGVTSIGYQAFSNCCGLTSITIPDSVTSIGGSAFSGCGGLTSVTIGNGVTSIGDYAFAYCYSIKNIYITDIVAWCSIDFDPHYANPLCHSDNNLYLNGELITHLIIPNNVTSIGEYAFYGCNELTSVTIGNGVTSIGVNAFCGCYKLMRINYAGNIKDWCNISGLYSIMSYGADDKTLYIDGKEITGNLTIPDSVTFIGGGAFVNCKGLTNITIPNSVTSIGYYAFENCRGLTSLTIGNGVTFIGEGAFILCNALTNVIFKNPNNWSRKSRKTEEEELSYTDLTNPQKAASLLRLPYVTYPYDIYYCYTWSRK